MGFLPNHLNTDIHHYLESTSSPTLYQINKPKEMKTPTLKLSMLLIVFLISTVSVSAQNYRLDHNKSKIIVEGTSNIHDWEIEVEQMSGGIQAVFEDGKLVKLENLKITIPATSLKSGKSGMDKNTYKALDTDKHPNIVYQLEKVDKIDHGTDKCFITTQGKLNISGTSRTVSIVFEAKVSGNTIVLEGKNELKMTNYNVDPPTAMFGTITTGDTVIVKFQTVFNK